MDHTAAASGIDGAVFDATILDEAVLAVSNMHCGGCVRGIERALADTLGIASAKANLSTKRVRVQFDPHAIDIGGVVEALGAAGFKAARFDGTLGAADEDEPQLLRCLVAAGVAAAGIMGLMALGWAGVVSAADAGLVHWMMAAIALPAVGYAGRPFYRSAWGSLRARRVNMDVPISLAVLLATGMSLWQTTVGAGEVYFDAAASLLFFLLIGRFLDARVRGKAREAAGDLLAFAATEATLVEPQTGAHQRVAVSEVGVGDRLFVASGDKIPADGVIEIGATEIDTSLITGESVPQKAGLGDTVYAGCINLGQAIELRALAMADDSLLADIAALMENADQGRDKFVRLADRAAKIYAPLVHGLGALTFVGWMLAGAGFEQALITAIAVLIITCPCALGLAVPAVQVVAAGRLFRKGVLVKTGAALERFAEIDRVVFDNTGTLTLGTPSLVEGASLDPAVLRRAASLALVSRHPLSRALVAAGTAQLGPIAAAGEAEEIPGSGVLADGSRLGSAEWCGIDEDRQTAASIGDTSVVWFAEPGAMPVAFRFRDALRADAAAVIRDLRGAGTAVTMLSGDRAAPVAAAAKALGIADAHASLSPKDKIEHLERLAAAGEKVLMVGDGLNDAPALAAAHASLSPSSAADISQNAADMVFQGLGLGAVPEVLQVAKAARRRVLENFAMAGIYNAVTIPLAMAGYVTPMLAAVAMSTSSILVTVNALRLRSSPKPWSGAGE
jgi:Cu2+-exporting ATPase